MSSDSAASRPATTGEKKNLESPAPADAHHYTFTVVETHLDIFGHMNNATYLQVLEEARWDVITGRGYGLKEIMAAQQGPVILEVKLSFKKELRNRQRVTIQTWCPRYDGKVGELVQTMINEKSEECARATFAFGLFDLKARRLIESTPAWRKALGLA